MSSEIYFFSFMHLGKFSRAYQKRQIISRASVRNGRDSGSLAPSF